MGDTSGVCVCVCVCVWETKPWARRVYMKPPAAAALAAPPAAAALPSAQEETRRAQRDRSNHVIDLPMLYYTAYYN